MTWLIKDTRTNGIIAKGEAKTAEACKKAALKTLEKELPFLNPAKLVIEVQGEVRGVV